MNADAAPDSPLSHPGTSMPTPGAALPPRKRRRWWVYALWTLAVLIFLAAAGVVGVALYWNHLVKTYTSTTAKPVPAVEASAEKFEELKQRWEAYGLLFLRPQERPAFELTADDLNVALTRFGPLRRRAFLEFIGNRLRLQFSVPLDETRNPSLQGRHLNGVASLQLELKNGRASLRLLSLEANGKPVPRWIFRRMQGVNWIERVNHRPEFDMVVRGLDRIDLGDGTLMLHPKPGLVVGR